MPYGDFAAREDVYGIISSTLTEHYGTKVSVAEKDEKTASENSMYCFSRIGIIIPQKPCREIKAQIKREYRITYSLPRKIIMNLYLAAVFALPKFLCEKKLVFSEGIVKCDMFIEPGNKKIKIVDYRSRTIENIVKTGFGSGWIRKEISIRNSGIEYLVPLRETKNGYIEYIHCGYSFPRLTEKEKTRHLPEVKTIIENFAGKESVVDAKEYIQAIVTEMNCQLRALKDNEKLTTTCKKAERIINAIVKKIDMEQIPICESHGDLQEGNLFYDIDEKKVYLIDMETYKKRSRFYDLMLLYYGFRNASRFIENVAKIRHDRGRKFGNGALDENEIMNVIRLFMLEDIEWQIDEMEIMPQGTVSNGMRIYTENLYDWIMENLA